MFIKSRVVQASLVKKKNRTSALFHSSVLNKLEFFVEDTEGQRLQSFFGENVLAPVSIDTCVVRASVVGWILGRQTGRMRSTTFSQNVV